MEQKTYKHKMMENLHRYCQADRYQVYLKMEDDIRSELDKQLVNVHTQVDRIVLFEEYQAYYIKKYYPTRGDFHERFYSAQLVRAIIAEIKKENV